MGFIHLPSFPKDLEIKIIKQMIEEELDLGMVLSNAPHCSRRRTEQWKDQPLLCSAI